MANVATNNLCDCEAISYLKFVTWAIMLWNQVLINNVDIQV
jgi:hypothetical protein